MTKVTKIDWTVKTGDQGWSGTDTPVQIEIYRDHELIQSLQLEPGRTPRLDRSELATYLWEAPPQLGGAGEAAPLGQGVAGTGQEQAASPFPRGYQEFPDGLAGHLRVRLIARGDDAWEKEWIESTVHTAELQPAPQQRVKELSGPQPEPPAGVLPPAQGPEPLVWVETRRTFRFGRGQVLSTDPAAGVRAITLLYDG
jgi:hypothetical protein